uniref:Uncharacterized protein n=1 Tax=Ananas comosus var. bracteatus TaxID=296719 RepID=A0A6V7QDY2_ANACO|nr:unnamed protein product [Ananas comosus var. bracteatus]
MANIGYMGRGSPHDRITELPEVLKLHILSLLSRKDAVRTGMLSTQWKDLWKRRFPYQTVLEFGTIYVSEDIQAQFVRQVNDFLVHYGNRRIETFHLYFNPGDHFERNVISWIELAVLCGVEEFYLNFSQGLTSCHPDGRLEYRRRRPELKEKIFKDNCLTVLNLHYCRLNRRFRFEHFPFLEILELHGVNINESMLERAVLCCPFLSKLDLSECMTLMAIKISGGPQLRLKYLRVVRCWNVDLIEISAPKLEVFHLFSRFPRMYLLYDISSLADVVLYSTVEQYWFHPNNWFETLSTFNHVRVLTLCNKAIQHMFGPGMFATVALPSVRVLDLSMQQLDDHDVMNIYRFFRQCYLPRLDKLLMQLPNSQTDPVLQQFNFDASREDSPDIPYMGLRVITISSFEGRMHHIMLLQFLLSRAIALRQVSIVLPHDLLLYSNPHRIINAVAELLRRSRAAGTATNLLLYPSQGRLAYFPLSVNY